MLVYLRHGGIYARLAAGFGVGIVTAYRYIRETVEPPADRAPAHQAGRPRGRAEHAGGYGPHHKVIVSD